MTQYSYSPTAGSVGSRATLDPVISVSRVYAGQAQTSTLTFGGVATDGDYEATFSDLDVANITVTVTRAAGVPATNTDLATAFVAAANADTDLRSMFEITSALGVVTVTARENGNPFTLTTSAPAPGTLVAATTVSASPANLPMGVGVALGAGPGQITVPSGTAFAIQGITWDGDSKTNQTQIPTLGQSDPFQAEFAPGSMVPIMKQGVVYVLPEVNITQGEPVFVRVVAAGTEQLGALRNDADGGDAVQIQAQWESSGSANMPTAVRVNIPGGA